MPGVYTSRMSLNAVRGNIAALWRRPFVRHVFTLQVGSVFARFFGVIKSVVFARLLGIEGFGIYVIAASFVSTFGFFMNLGQAQSLILYLAEEFGNEDRRGMKAVLRYFCIFTLLAAFVILAFAFASPVLVRFFYQENTQPIAGMAVLGFLTALVSLPFSLVSSLLQIVGKIRLMTILENTDLVLQLVLGALFVFMGIGPIGVFLGLFVSNCIMAFLYGMIFFRLRRETGLPGLRESFLSKEPIGTYILQGFFISLDKNVSNFFPNGLMFLMSLATPPGMVAVARLALSMSDLPGSFLLAHAVRMSQTALPKMKEKGTAFLRSQCALLIKHTLLFHACVVFGGMVVFPFGVILAYGWEYSAVIVPMWWLLLIRLLQPFNIANVSIVRLFRKVHVTTSWNAVRIVLELVCYVLVLQFTEVSPLTALLFTVLAHQLTGLLENGYVYGVLLRKSAS